MTITFLVTNKKIWKKTATSSPPGGDGAHGIFVSSGISGFGYGVVITTVALAIYFCTRTSMPVSTAAPRP